MRLYALKREYEERRAALVDKLKKGSDLDPSTQHQIYGAIKEIENFLQAIEYQMQQEQSQQLDLDLDREKSKPLFERTRKAVAGAGRGTKKIFTQHIPSATHKVTSLPKRYLERRREMRALRRQIEKELRERRAAERALDPAHIHEEVSGYHSRPPTPGGESGTVIGVNETSDHEMVDVRVQQVEYSDAEPLPQQIPPELKPMKKATKKSGKAKRASVKKNAAKKPVKKTAKRATKKRKR